MKPSVPDTDAPTPRRRGGRAYLVLTVVAVLVAGGWFLHRHLTAGQEKTDDAQVEADVLPVPTRVAGVVVAARVQDNQSVAAGDVLFEIDSAQLDLQIASAQADVAAAKAQHAVALAQVSIVESSSRGGLSSAKAALTGAGASVRASTDSIHAAEASVAKATADLHTATADLTRAKALGDKGAITVQDVERATQTSDVAQAALDAANAGLSAARAQRGQAQAMVVAAKGHVEQSAPVDAQMAAVEAAAQLAAARVQTAETALARAQLERSYATIVAPFNGVISKLGAHTGQAVAAGQTLLMLVPTETYVVANFKEAQIARIRPGDKVDIELDAYDQEFTGIVDTVSPATGSRFSMLPPDNATGNFVKVVQRVPVKIRWTKPPAMVLRPGLSADVIVHVAN